MLVKNPFLYGKLQLCEVNCSRCLFLVHSRPSDYVPSLQSILPLIGWTRSFIFHLRFYSIDQELRMGLTAGTVYSMRARRALCAQQFYWHCLVIQLCFKSMLNHSRLFNTISLLVLIYSSNIIKVNFFKLSNWTLFIERGLGNKFLQ